ncbi:MAG TPA: hypothetical protein VL405_03270 [Sphingomonas sp.]|nr:hypothetical protein [Sphingomonas sp.]
MEARHTHWWETRGFAAALVLISMLPLLWPTVPPLVDLPGHMGRYQVELAGGANPALAQFYTFRWALIGNLGVDLLIIPMAKLFGLELGIKLIVMTIPALTVGGLIWICREVNREVQPMALFALPLAYGHPFQFGFVNFALAMALALMAFALWLRLARLGLLRLRALIFLLIGPVIWVTHTYGWGMLGVAAFSAELIRQHDKSRAEGDGSWPRSIFWASVHCLSLAPPLILMILWRSGAHVGGQTGDWFNWSAKLLWLNLTLRDRWRWFDAASLAVIVLALFAALRDPRLQFSRNLAATAIFLALTFLCLPRIVFGSAYADMRLTPYMFAIALIAIRLKPDTSMRFAGRLAAAGLAFYLVRIAATTASFFLYGQSIDRVTAALPNLPRGARVVSFVGASCVPNWATNRMEHVPAMAIVRRDAFSNDQWNMAGAQLLRAHISTRRWFNSDPSQIVTAGKCRGEWWKSLNWSLANFPRDTFDYVWLLDPPPYNRYWTRGLAPVWRDGTSVLYRVVDRTQPRPSPDAFKS